MVSYLGTGLGRVIVISLQRDDLLLEMITDELEKYNIKNAIVTSAIGSLQKAVFHRVVAMGEKPEDEFVTLERPIELASLQGVVIDGKPHFHMVVSDTEKAYSGHLECGTKVLYLSEITLTEVLGISLERNKDANNIAVLREIAEESL